MFRRLTVEAFVKSQNRRHAIYDHAFLTCIGQKEASLNDPQIPN